MKRHALYLLTLWCQLEDMFQLIVTPQGIDKVTIQLIDTPTKVYAIGARLFLSKVPLEVLQNWVLIQLIVTPHILGKVQGQIKEVCRLIEPCLLIGTREYVSVKTAHAIIQLRRSSFLARCVVFRQIASSAARRHLHPQPINLYFHWEN